MRSDGITSANQSPVTATAVAAKPSVSSVPPSA